jgi:hypothetical protein
MPSTRFAARSFENLESPYLDEVDVQRQADGALGRVAAETSHEAGAIPGVSEHEDERVVEPDEFELGGRSSQEEGETPRALGQKLRVRSLPLHTVEVGGTDTALTPDVMDPGIYDGPEKYRVAATLQQSVMAAMNTAPFRHIRVALVDLTRDVGKPAFAGFNHKQQVFAASVPKIAAMLGAFQLRHDLRAALKQKRSATRDELFAAARADWGGTGAHPYPKAPELEEVFADVKAGAPVAVEFGSTGETKEQLQAIIDEFDTTAAAEQRARKRLAEAKGEATREKEASQRLSQARQRFAAARRKLEALGFLERMRIMVGGIVPASNYATSTVVRRVGFVYIASALLQSGLHDPRRKGGLWLAADYGAAAWTNGLALGGGIAQSATAGSLAAFMTLLAQGRLVSREASSEMAALMKKEPNPTHPGIVSWFKDGLKELKDGGLVKRVLSKLGAHGGLDDCTLIERHVEVDGSRTTLRYVAVGLRARNKGELRSLILELDKCILANNGFTPAQGGHS